jgi:hypothetical protein
MPLAIDMFSGLHGWASSLAAEGWDVIAIDIEDMCAKFGVDRPPHVQLVIQDVLTLHGSQLRNADLIVASPPCQEYSYMAMPWKRAKAKAERYWASESERAKLTALFDACFRIQREASAAAGRHIPMVVENVRGAIPWVGSAAWNFGSYYLWGDVPALMPVTLRGAKNPGFRFDGSGRSFQSESVNTHIKLSRSGSKSPARKAASAKIAKIPFALSAWIARTYRPQPISEAAA